MAVADKKNNIGKYEGILSKPRVTEKASVNAENNVYVFDIASNANKIQVKEAVRNIHKVNPVKVNITKVPSKVVMTKGRKGVKKGGVKAYIYLKKGETIELA